MDKSVPLQFQSYVEDLSCSCRTQGDKRKKGWLVDARINGIDARMNGIDARMNGIDACMNGIDAHMNGIDARMNGIDRCTYEW